MAWAAALAILSGVAIDTVWREVDQLANAIETTRSFFGITRVENRLIPPGNTRVMRHGRIAHGSQFTSDPLRREPTAYFGRTSGVGVAFRRYRLLLDPPDRGLRVGIVGLGAGTLAAYGRDGDLFRFYEIDSEVERIARNYFAYIQDSSAEVEVLLGDARLTLARATVSEEFDILILDAFTGDAVPVHLLTREAYQIYLSHLRPGGLLVFQVSNRYLDLGIVVRGLAEEAGQETVSITTTGDLYVDTHEASYVIATNNREFLADPTVRLLAEASPPVESAPRIWTDAFASLWTVMADRHWGDQWDAAPNLGHFVVDRGALLTIEDEIRVKTLSQALYAHSGGKSAMVVITAPSLQAGGAGQTPLPEFVSHLFQKVGLASPEITDGLLVFISEKDRQAGFLVSPSWPAQLHEQLSRDFNNHTLQALAAGESSRGITDFAERFDHLVRTKMAGEAHYLQGEPL
jgi:SAM-dependent methyltransferase